MFGDENPGSTICTERPPTGEERGCQIAQASPPKADEATSVPQRPPDMGEKTI